MRAARVISLALSLFALTANEIFSAPSEKYERLYRESSDFRAAEDALNDIWKKLRPELRKSEWRRLLDDQRQWLKEQERLLAEAKGSELEPYLREACDRALKLTDYYRAISENYPLEGTMVKTEDERAGWRTSLKLGNTECSRVYPLRPPLKFEEIPEENRDLPKRDPNVAELDFYGGAITLSDSKLFAKKEDPPAAEANTSTTVASEEREESKTASNSPPGEASGDIAAKSDEESPALENSENHEQKEKKSVNEKSSSAESDDSIAPTAEKTERPKIEKREPSIPKEEADRILAGLGLRLKRNGDYIEYYVAAREPCLIEGYELDGGESLSSDDRAKKTRRPRKARPDHPLYLFSMPATENISRIELFTEAGAKNWSLEGN